MWWFQNSKIDVGIDVTAATKQKCTSLGMQNSCGSQTVDASFLGIDFADGIAKTALYVQYQALRSRYDIVIIANQPFAINCGNQ